MIMPTVQPVAARRTTGRGGQYIGIEIGGTKLQVAAGDSSLRITKRWRGAVDPAGGAQGICQQIEQAMKPMLAGARIKAIGVGFGGPINWQTGRVERSHQVAGWKDFPLKDWFVAHTSLPIAVDNDANVAALGEAVAGAGAGHDPAFYVTLGSGVGGGLSAGKRIYHGATPGECEFGHIRLDRSGATVESRCSGWAIDRRIREAIASQPNGTLARLVGNTTGGEAKHLAQALAQGDPAARQILNELGADLGFALSHAVHLLHPQVIILGGGLSLIGEPLLATVADHLPSYVMEAFQPPPPIQLAKLGEDAVPIGALQLALSQAQKS